MPSYDYRCDKCGKFTITQSIKDKALTECPTCSSSVSRLIGKNVNIIFKCSGFYSTDTKSPSGSVDNSSPSTTTTTEAAPGSTEGENKAV